jgi:hypothetical protein
MTMMETQHKNWSVGWVLAHAVLFTFVVVSGCHGGLWGTATNRTELWNGKDFAGWKRVVGKPLVDVDTIWQVRDGVIYCTGLTNGYMRTQKKYHNYHLHVEWRWPDKPANSGVFIHVSDPDRVWPSCIECQLQAGNAGDFILMNGAGLTVNGVPRQEASKQFVMIAKKAPTSEKPPGDWNSYDIYCAGSSVRAVVNGIVQNEGTNAAPPVGYIALQSEGGPIEFRNIYLVPAE